VSKKKKKRSEAKVPAKESLLLSVDWIPALFLLFGILTWGLLSHLGLFQPGVQQIIGVDPVGYYAWPHSIFWDHDLHFENEYRRLRVQEFAAGDTSTDPDGPKTSTGKLGNMFSIGPGLLWSPFLLCAHVIATQKDGFSQPYHSAVYFANLFYGVTGAVLMFYLLRTWFERWMSFWCALGAWAASSAFYYTFAQEAMSHTCSMFAVALFLLLWARLRDGREWWRWAAIGAGLGLVALVRWQDAVLAVIPTIDLLSRDWKKNLSNLCVCGVFTIAAFFPQMIGWKVIYGSFFTIPQGGAFMTWARPAVLGLFFSADHGLATWTPLCLFGVVGLFSAPSHLRRVYWCLAAALVIQLYVTSCAGNLGWTFGMRRLVSCVPLFAMGLAALCLRFKLRAAIYGSIVAMFALWNFLFVAQYLGILDQYYVIDGIVEYAAEHKISPDKLAKTGTLPDGTKVNLQAMANGFVFPKSGGPSFSQFVTDKALVMRALFNSDFR
jgi:hypothetical protein